jgi:hypothetical protein
MKEEANGRRRRRIVDFIVLLFVFSVCLDCCLPLFGLLTRCGIAYYLSMATFVRAGMTWLGYSNPPVPF